MIRLGREFTGKRTIDGIQFKMVVFYTDRWDADVEAEELRKNHYARVIPIETTEYDGNVLKGFGVYKSTKKRKKK